MTWEDDLRQEINNAGGFTESEVNDLVIVFQNQVKPIMQLVAKQAEDWGLWGQAEYASEACIQEQLRELHKVIEEQLGDCRDYL